MKDEVKSLSKGHSGRHYFEPFGDSLKEYIDTLDLGRSHCQHLLTDIAGGDHSEAIQFMSCACGHLLHSTAAGKRGEGRVVRYLHIPIS